ncbi:MAG: EAL domain-containing protein [Ketobacteraceae bacterium]|nr:EAL domain-containing protein [Ketobacteraceae bacterium]
MDLSDDDLETVFRENRISVLYQPVVPLEDHGTILAVEAYARIDHPDFGTLAPAIFLERLRGQGLLLELTKSVIRRIAKDWKAWQAIGHDLLVSVNLDYSLLSFNTLSKELSELLKSVDVPRRRLMLELSAVNARQLTREDREQITRLRMKGFRLAIDNMGRLPMEPEEVEDLPIDQLKIDRSIIGALKDHSDPRNTVRKILAIASRLGADVIAVGIETGLDLEWLRRNGCRAGQGYLFGPPLAADGFSHIYLNQPDWRVRNNQDFVNLLLVEDDPQYQALLFEALSHTYNVAVANTSEEARKLFEAHKPKLLLLDVLLPDGSGVALCADLVRQYGSDSFSTIFISGKDDVSVRMEAYSAGGMDFIQKPFSMADLVAKIDRASASQQKRTEMLARSEALHDAAMGSMREAAHYGDVVQFMKSLFRAYDEKAVASELFRFMRPKGLVCSVQLRSSESTICFAQDGGLCSPMEINIFELLRERGRIIDFSRRTIFNDQHVSVLIKNMPEQDEERGRIRDYMAALIEGLEARFTDILRRRLLESVSEEVNTLARELAQNLEDDKKRNRAIMEKATLDLQMSFHLLNLTEEQEQHITGIIETMHKSAEESELSGAQISERVQSLVALLASVVEAGNSADRSPMESQHRDDVELF